MAQLVNVDLRRGEHIVWSSSRTVSDMWIMNGWFRRLPASAEVDELGSVVGQGLDASREAVAQPPLRDAPLPFQPVLDDLRVPSYGKYLNGTRSVLVQRDDGTVSITSYRNAGARGGFVPIEGTEIRLEKPDAAAVGSAVLDALARST
jgi:hypothetical protein